MSAASPDRPSARHAAKGRDRQRDELGGGGDQRLAQAPAHGEEVEGGADAEEADRQRGGAERPDHALEPGRQADPRRLQDSPDRRGDDERVRRDRARDAGKARLPAGVSGQRPGCRTGSRPARWWRWRRRRARCRAAEKPGRDGQADIVVEADAALEHRGESRPVDREPRPQGDEKRRDPGQRQRDHQHQARDRHPREVGHGEAVDEERRQEDEIGEPLGPGPERVGQETRPPEPRAERDQPGGRRERQEDRADHAPAAQLTAACPSAGRCAAR